MKILYVTLSLLNLLFIACGFKCGGSLKSFSSTRSSDLHMLMTKNRFKISKADISFRTFAESTFTDKRRENSKALAVLVSRCCWFSWWVQIILTVISAVILTFANTVRNGSMGLKQIWASGFGFSSLGVVVAFISCFWTWQSTAFTRRVLKKEVDEDAVVPTFRRNSMGSVILSLMGMLFSLLGAEQVVGTLATKALSTGFQTLPPVFVGGALSSMPSPLQALDIFLVQANTNALIAHYAPLVSSIWLQSQYPKHPINPSSKNQTGNEVAS